ncbi:phosphatidylinositol-glycan biosynthesis class S protein-domain-containing protein [Crassisporium funariophilum]|nr:phosphatidylinositol-glycan biosynthesis class S protein-domain-containing protein [Crassisporium funariophilum]
MDPPPDHTQVNSQNVQEEDPLPSSLRDPAKLFYQQDGVRRSIIIAYWAIIILAVPLWWYTTSIERLSLPSSRVHQQTQRHPELPVKICLEAVDSSLVGNVKQAFAGRISQQQDMWRGLAIEVFGQKDCQNVAGDNVHTVTFKAGPLSIRQRVLNFPLNDTFSPDKLVDTITSLIVPHSLVSDRGNRVAQYSPRYRVAFSLLNEDAAAGSAVMGWDIQGAFKSHIHPILDCLSTLHNFTIESQVQFHAPLAFTPIPIDQAYGITQEDLTVFVNSAEWTLSSSSSNDPVLHFILFIPSNTRRPLGILNHDGTPSLSNAFLLPQWGGIVIHNPSDTFTGGQLSHPDLNAVFASFASQLLALLGVARLPAAVQYSASDHASVLSEWQVDSLLRRRTLENAQGSQDTLLSIVKLVDQIENMPVHNDVKGDVQDALSALTKMHESSTASLDEAFAYSAEALSLASRAFFNPGMLALLYFPAEHKYAVYTPLFASAVIPLAVAALREIMAWRRERKSASI